MKITTDWKRNNFIVSLIFFFQFNEIIEGNENEIKKKKVVKFCMSAPNHYFVC